MAFRIALAKRTETDEVKKARHAKLNDEVLAKLQTHIGKDKWEEELVRTIAENNNRDENHMFMPVLKNAASKFHDKAAA